MRRSTVFTHHESSLPAFKPFAQRLLFGETSRLLSLCPQRKVPRTCKSLLRGVTRTRTKMGCSSPKLSCYSPLGATVHSALRQTIVFSRTENPGRPQENQRQDERSPSSLCQADLLFLCGSRPSLPIQRIPDR